MRALQSPHEPAVQLWRGLGAPCAPLLRLRVDLCEVPLPRLLLLPLLLQPVPAPAHRPRAATNMWMPREGSNARCTVLCCYNGGAHRCRLHNASASSATAQHARRASSHKPCAQQRHDSLRALASLRFCRLVNTARALVPSCCCVLLRRHARRQPVLPSVGVGCVGRATRRMIHSCCSLCRCGGGTVARAAAAAVGTIAASC